MTSAITEKPESRNGVARGYMPAARPRYLWVTYEATALPDGADVPPGGEPFRAQIRSNLTFGEIEDLDPNTLTWLQLFPVMAPHVVAWTLLGTEAATGDVKPVPPPAEAGPDAFRMLDKDLAWWLLMQLRAGHLGGDERKKEFSAPDSLPAPASDGPSD